jgi:hypothetical protein
MSRGLDIARGVVATMRANAREKELGFTTYCALVANSASLKRRMVFIAEAGASADGISGPFLTRLENAYPDAAFLGCAAPLVGDGTWAMNDAERQAIRIYQAWVQDGGGRVEFHRPTIEAVVATRPICESCCSHLRQLGLQVAGAEAVAH